MKSNLVDTHLVRIRLSPFLLLAKVEGDRPPFGIVRPLLRRVYVGTRHFPPVKIHVVIPWPLNKRDLTSAKLSSTKAGGVGTAAWSWDSLETILRSPTKVESWTNHRLFQKRSFWTPLKYDGWTGETCKAWDFAAASATLFIFWSKEACSKLKLSTWWARTQRRTSRDCSL